MDNLKENKMKLKQFMQENTVTGFEVIENQVAFSVITNGVYTALDTDTSNIPNGTKLSVVEDFTVDNDIVSVAGINIDSNEVEVRVPEDRNE